MGLKQSYICYACQVAVFSKENCNLFFYFLITNNIVAECGRTISCLPPSLRDILAPSDEGAVTVGD